MRLFTCREEENFIECFKYKVMFAFALITFLMLLVNVVYLFRMNWSKSNFKLIFIYFLCITNCLIIILHYGFIPRWSNFNSYCAVLQEFLKFTFYFFVIFILVRSSIKVAFKNKIPRKYCVIFAFAILNAIYILCILIIAFVRSYQQKVTKFCTDYIWILLRVSHFFSAILLLILGWLFRKQIWKKMMESDMEISEDLQQEMWKLKIITCISIIESSLHVGIDMVYVISDPAECSRLTQYAALNSLLWLFFRWLSNNLWIWTALYVFNARFIYKQRKKYEYTPDETTDDFSYRGDALNHLLRSVDLTEREPSTAIPSLRVEQPRHSTPHRMRKISSGKFLEFSSKPEQD